MLIRCGLLLLFLNCLKTTAKIHDGIDGVNDFNRRFALWPSVHNAATLMRVRRQDGNIGPNGISEGDTNMKPAAPLSTTTLPSQQANKNNSTKNELLKSQVASQGSNVSPGQSDGQSGSANTTNISTDTTGPNVANPGIDAKPKSNAGKPGATGASEETVTKPGSNSTKSATSDASNIPSNSTNTSPSPVISNSAVTPVLNATDNSTSVAKPTKVFDLKDPGVVKRGFIVFGGFALLAVAYYLFYYRRKSNNNPSSTTHSLTDTNQFRYGVLQSEDKRDTELSRVPLTMESDEDEEEDLEIFDLEQKKKSLSYVNLQTNDEDVVFSLNDHEDDRGNLLLDIEDGTSETLINWSSTGNNKSIL